MRQRLPVLAIAITVTLLLRPEAVALSPSAFVQRPFEAGPARPAWPGVLSLAQSSDDPDDEEDDDDDAADDDIEFDDDIDDGGGDDSSGDDDGDDDDDGGGDDDGGDDDDDDDDDGDGDGDDDDEARDSDRDSGRDRFFDDDVEAGARARDFWALGPDEIYDGSGYLARRGQLLALNPSPRALATARSLGYEVDERFRLTAAGFEVVRFTVPESQRVSDALAALRAADPATSFDYEHLYDFSPSGIGDIERPGAAAVQPRARLSERDDLRIGLIDSAVDPATPAIRAARIQQRVFVSTGEPPTREHGTAVASILASRDNGLLPRSQYFVASVFHQSYRGDSVGAAADLARALDWLMAQRTPVINMSLAGPPNAILEAAIRRAQDRGHIVVAAVGNAGPAARPQYPAAYAGVVGVTAIDASGRVYRRAVRGEHVDFAAPGVAVAAAGPAGADSAVSGTSFAAPYVAAALAVRHTAIDQASAQRAVAELARDAADLGDPGQDPVYGHGAVPLQASAR